MVQISFKELVSIENLFRSWRRFRRGKRERLDVIVFERHLEDNLFELADDLVRGTYRHGPYHVFRVRDPKSRIVHKATVRDRVVHQALFDALYPEFNKRFIFDSYSSRRAKGTLAAINRLVQFVRSASMNGRRRAWTLHGDAVDFFGSVDHAILVRLLERRVTDERMRSLFRLVVGSFEKKPGIGLPLGNLTSQLFANEYFHEFDRFAKQEYVVPRYLRYNDDFFVVSNDRDALQKFQEEASHFLNERLRLSATFQIIRIEDGVDALGNVLWPGGRSAPRARNRRAAEQATRDLIEQGFSTTTWRTAVSYLGLLKHSRSYILQERLRMAAW